MEGCCSSINAQGKCEMHSVYAKTKKEYEVPLEKMATGVQERIKEEERRAKEPGTVKNMKIYNNLDNMTLLHKKQNFVPKH